MATIAKSWCGSTANAARWPPAKVRTPGGASATATARRAPRRWIDAATTAAKSARFGSRSARAEGGRPPMTIAIDRVDHIVLNCRDLETTVAWYQRVLG